MVKEMEKSKPALTRIHLIFVTPGSKRPKRRELVAQFSSDLRPEANRKANVRGVR
jgi:hypothetical protein